MEIDYTDFTFDNEYGPISYKGFHWTGQITEIYWETWKLDQGVPKQVGVREFITPATHSPQLQFNEFLSNPPSELQKVLDWEIFRTRLKLAIRRMAVARFCEWRYLRAKNAGDDIIGDPDYEPPSLFESKDK